MKIIEAAERVPQDKDFTGDVVLGRAMESADGDPIKLYRVEFSAGARTDWHTHDGMQILHVITGECRVQKEGEPFHDLGVGSCAIIEAGEKHWHGASPNSDMMHVAIGLYDGTDWMESVSDNDYLGK